MLTQIHICLCDILADTDCSGSSAANSTILQTTRDQVRLSLPLDLSLNCWFSFGLLSSFMIHHTHYQPAVCLIYPVVVALSLIFSALPSSCKSVCHTCACAHLFSFCKSLTVSANPYSPCLAVFLGHRDTQGTDTHI